MDIYTIRTGSVELKKSELWLRQAIWLKRILAEKVGDRWIISGAEIRRVKENPFQITRKELGGL